jgi:hypothetical protein
MRRRLLFSVGILTAALVLGGCYEPTEGPKLLALPSYDDDLLRITAGRSVEGHAIDCIVMGQGEQTTFVIGAIHGDEPSGVGLVQELCTVLYNQPQLLNGRMVLLMAVANPDGLAQNSRLNANKVDLNRNFEAPNRTNDQLHGHEAFSEPEARAIRDLIYRYDVNRIVSIHQLTDMGYGGLVHRIPNGCIDYDGDGIAIAEHMAKFCELPVEKLGASPGSLGAYSEQMLEIPCITLELPPDAHLLGSSKLWERYGKALAAAVTYPDTPE